MCVLEVTLPKFSAYIRNCPMTAYPAGVNERARLRSLSYLMWVMLLCHFTNGYPTQQGKNMQIVDAYQSFYWLKNLDSCTRAAKQ